MDKWKSTGADELARELSVAIDVFILIASRSLRESRGVGGEMKGQPMRELRNSCFLPSQQWTCCLLAPSPQSGRGEVAEERRRGETACEAKAPNDSLIVLIEIS
jgi:hypothetical protein